METKNQDQLLSPKVINEGHYIELLDRTHVMCCTIDTHLINHPLATVDKDIKFQLEHALGQLYDAYQIIGQKMVNYESKRID